jgi:DNA-binding SARP family transcriptional activator
MQALRIHLFGGVEVFRGETLLPAFPTQRSLSLFAFLVLSRGRLVHRDTVCGQFWGEQSDVEARKALRNCLWRIRSVIEPGERERGAYLQVEGSQIRFAPGDDTWVDAWEFEDSLKPPSREVPERAAVERLERAAALYRGDFLEGLHDHWCFLHRERLRLAYLTALERLVAHHRSGARWLEVIAYGRQILREDPLREHIHRTVMESHLRMGDRPSALRQYACCARTLRAELDIEPMEETRRLHDRIRRGEPLGLAQLHGRTGDVRGDFEVNVLVAEVEVALTALHALMDQLEHTRASLASEASAGGVLGARPRRRRLDGVEAAS